MTDGVSIRRARVNDRSAIRRLHRGLYVAFRDEKMPTPLRALYAYREFDRVLDDDVAAMLADDSVFVFLAEDDDVPIGYITGHVDADPRRVHSRKGIVGDWYVEPDRRHRGAGRLLFDALVSQFADAGCEIVESSTWPFNDATRRLHERLGFAEVQVTYRKLL
jgi:GNAT superfamily N-acetyltransferase